MVPARGFRRSPPARLRAPSGRRYTGGHFPPFSGSPGGFLADFGSPSAGSSPCPSRAPPRSRHRPSHPVPPRLGAGHGGIARRYPHLVPAPMAPPGPGNQRKVSPLPEARLSRRAGEQGSSRAGHGGVGLRFGS